MSREEIVFHLRFVLGAAVIGAGTASIFFGWIDRSVDMQTVGAVIGASAASLKVFNIV